MKIKKVNLRIAQTIVLSGIIMIFYLFAEGQVNHTTHDGDKKFTNLKVLPKDISHDSLHALMKMYSKSLGVKCSHCHVPRTDDPKKLDFVSDEKPQKEMSRKMIVMTEKINKKYLKKMNSLIDPISCVTCHNGRKEPINSVDSLQIMGR